jgi:hypothetical protein
MFKQIDERLAAMKAAVPARILKLFNEPRVTAKHERGDYAGIVPWSVMVSGFKDRLFMTAIGHGWTEADAIADLCKCADDEESKRREQAEFEQWKAQRAAQAD